MAVYLEAIMAGGGGDWFNTVVVTAPNGSIITLDDGDEEVTAIGTGTYVGIPVHNPSSTYAIDVEIDGFHQTDSVATTAVSGDMMFKEFVFGSITLTYGDEFKGQTLTVTDGTSTSNSIVAPSDANTMTIHVPNLGSWTISATDPETGTSYSAVATVADYSVPGTAELYTIPDGSTVLPTDDIQTWLACAAIDKDYTSLSDVYSDEIVLRKLMTDDNAIDYMVRSKSFAGVGNVPKMTSNTTPEGRAFSSGSPAGNDAYMAFDHDDDTEAKATTATTTPGYFIGYIFDEPIDIGQIICDGTTGYAITWKLQTSNDTTNGTDGTWTDAGYTLQSGSAIGKTRTNFSSRITAKAFRLVSTAIESSGTTYFTLRELNFSKWMSNLTEIELAMGYIGAYDYAAEQCLDDEDWRKAIINSEYSEQVIHGLIPVMTSDTQPRGEASGSSVYSGTHYYSAFNGDLTTYWVSELNEVVNSYIQYEFPEPVKAVRMKYQIAGSQSTYTQHDVTLTLYGSNDDFATPGVLLKTINQVAANNKTIQTIDFDNDTAYKSYRLMYSDYTEIYTQYSQKFTCCAELQLYGHNTGAVQNWLKAAGLDRPYTSLQDVLDDKPTLQILMTNHAAVNYLVTAKALIEGITADESAMKYIGRRNYASETLLSDSDWSLAISESNYWDKVLSPSIPTLAADSAKVIKSSELTGSEAWTAFDNVDSSGWAAVDTASGSHLNNAYIGYDFDEPILVNRIQFDNFKVSASQYTFTASLRIEGSNDGFVSDVHDLSGTITTSSRENIFNLSNDTKYRYYRVFITDFTSNSQAKPYLNTLQFYGRADVDESIIDIYSAVSDNDIYYLNNGSPVTVGSTDSSGFGTLDKDDIADGVYDLYSSVAKDPDTWVKGTAYADAPPYHKKVRIDENTIEINLMPDNAQYWFGNNINTGNARTNGYSWGGMMSAGDYNAVYNAISVSLASGSTDGHASGVGVLKALKKYFKGHYLGAFTKSGTYGIQAPFALRNTKTFSSGSTAQLGMEGTFIDEAGTKTGHTYGKPYVNLKAGEPPVDINDVIWMWLCSYYSGSATIYGMYYDKKANFFSAANDTVYYEDAGGTQVILAYTDKYGEAIVDFSLLPEGDYTLYSSVAKNPDDLTQPYSKTVHIQPGLRNLYFMPDYTLYWYGYKSPNMEVMNAANGWTTSISNHSFVDPTFNADSVTISASTNQICGISSKIPLTNKRLCTIGKGTGFTCINLNAKNIASRPGFDNAITDTTLKKYATRTTDNDKLTYKIAYTANSRSMELNALYCDTTNVFSAANDTIYYEAAGGSQVVVAETNDQGEALIDISAIPNGTYRMYSSVAKNPDDLTQPYYKDITITDDTKEIRLMPDNAIYWYGWRHELAYSEYDTVNNGWTAASTTSFGNLLMYPTGTDNIDFSIAASAYNTKCLSYAKQLPTGTVVKSVGYCNKNQAYFVAGLTASTTKKCEGSGSENQAAYFPASANYSANSLTLSRDAYICWLSVHQSTGGASAINAGLKALWYEN